MNAALRMALQATPPGAARTYDFTSALPSGVTFARTGAGTALTTTGGVTAFTTGAARITDRGLLVEAAATNLTIQSWNAATWTPTAVALTGGQADPKGTTGAVLVTGNGAATAHQVVPASTTFATGAYAFSLLVKAGSLAFIQLSASTGRFGTGQYANYALSGAGAVSAAGGAVVASGVQALAGGWYLIWYAANCTSAGSGAMIVNLITSATDARFAAPATSGDLSIVGAQCEAGSAVSSSIVTTSAAATRGADSASVIVPGGASAWTAIYNGGLTASGAATAGATFDLVTGRPWLGGYLQRITFA